MSLRKIRIIEPICTLLRTQIAEHQTASVAEDPKHPPQHARLVLYMMQGVLTGDDIKTLRLKGESCPIGLHPGDVWRFGLGLPQHTQGSIESHQSGVGHHG